MIPQKKTSNCAYYTTAVLTCGVGPMLCCVWSYCTTDNSKPKKIGPAKSTILTSDKRISRVSKSKILSTVPIIVYQEVSKLGISTFEASNIRNNVSYDIGNDIDEFLKNYLLRSYKFDINNSYNIGVVLIKFRQDSDNDDYIYVTSAVQIKQINKKYNQQQQSNMLKQIEYNLDNLK